MDRRTLLALASCLPLAGSASALACSPVLRNPGMSGREIHQVGEIFQSWWMRDIETFRAFFTTRLMDDGSKMEPGIAAELIANNPVPQETLEIFDRHFTDESKIKKLPLVIGTAAGVVVFCSEDNGAQGTMEADCSGMPQLHIFLVEMSGLNPRSILHMATASTVDIEKFEISTFVSE